MDTRKQARALTLGLALALGAGGTGVALAQNMGGGMMGDDGGMGMMGCEGGMGMMGREGGMGMMGREGGMGMMGCGKGMGPGMGSGKGMGPGMGLMREMQAMRDMLSAEQRGELRELMREQRPAQFERMGHAQNVREDLMAELEQDRPDPDAVREIHGRMAEIHGEMLVERVRMRNAIYDLLTDEQREQLASGTPENGDASVDHHGHHGGR